MMRGNALPTDLDLSYSAFSALANVGLGLIQAEWSWAPCSGPTPLSPPPPPPIDPIQTTQAALVLDPVQNQQQDPAQSTAQDPQPQAKAAMQKLEVLNPMPVFVGAQVPASSTSSGVVGSMVTVASSIVSLFLV
ncbi:UNVERIFIED_CONTAM: hypothetical protein HDU68_008834 [Siphonaria sp. JEL0065]|nr:hypothetical protein HDU68_008834 [Siphonaria sp. JEL0065]